MGIPVLILGESGTGKSASLRNFKAEDVKVINVANKPLPFKNKLESVSVDTYEKILKELKNSNKKSIVIDDSQYIMSNEFMRRATERGFDKFTEIAFHMWDIVESVKDLPADTVVYFLSHIDRDNDGNEKVKTIGKLLDEKITLEGMYTIVLKTNVSDGQYSFITQNSGKDTVKSPIGLFDSYAIDNDLKYVDEKIRNYYELGEFLSDEDIAELDEEAKKVDVIKDEKKPRRSRGSDTNNNAQPTKSNDTASGENEATPRRRSRAEVEESNRQKELEYARARAEADEAQWGDQIDNIPFEAECDSDKIPRPELEPLPRETASERRTRKSRTAEAESTEVKEAESEPTMNAPVEETATAPARRRRRA